MNRNAKLLILGGSALSLALPFMARQMERLSWNSRRGRIDHNTADLAPAKFREASCGDLWNLPGFGRSDNDL